MSILNRAIDKIDSTKHYDGARYSVYTYEAIRIARELAGDYDAEVAKEKARADAYEVIIKNLRLTFVATSGEEEAPEPLEPSFIDLGERTKEKGGRTTKNITLEEPGGLDMVAEFETGQVRLCAAGDSYYDNFVSFKDFLGFAEELKEALEEKK